MNYLTDEPIDTAGLVRETLRSSDGACVVFEGVVRNHHDGKRVESIFYDAYRPMAEKSTLGPASRLWCGTPKPLREGQGALEVRHVVS